MTIIAYMGVINMVEIYFGTYTVWCGKWKLVIWEELLEGFFQFPNFCVCAFIEMI